MGVCMYNMTVFRTLGFIFGLYMMEKSNSLKMVKDYTYNV